MTPTDAVREHLTIEGKDITPLSAILMKPPKARACFVFAHGAVAGMSHVFMEQSQPARTLGASRPFAISFPSWRRAASGRIRPQLHTPPSGQQSTKHTNNVAGCLSSPAASPSAGV
jgi:hypothetical protein